MDYDDDPVLVFPLNRKPGVTGVRWPAIAIAFIFWVTVCGVALMLLTD